MNTDKLINCIAVDDEPPALQLIEKYIHSVPVFNLVGTCANAVVHSPCSGIIPLNFYFWIFKCRRYWVQNLCELFRIPRR